MKKIIKYIKSNHILGFENFTFYLIISGIEAICLLLLILRYGYNIFSTSKIPDNQTLPIYVYVIISIALIMFLVIYIYIMRKLPTKKSLYEMLKTLFPFYLLFIFLLLIGIFASESKLMHSKAWFYLALLIWIECYIVTEVMITIFKEKIFPSWSTVSTKDKYSILIPLITFILGYILN